MRRGTWVRLIVVGCVIVVMLAILWRRAPDKTNAAYTDSATDGQVALHGSADIKIDQTGRSPAPAPASTAQEVVARKVVQFGRNRRELIRAIAWRTGKEIPAEVEKFFDAVEAGD